MMYQLRGLRMEQCSLMMCRLDRMRGVSCMLCRGMGSRRSEQGWVMMRGKSFWWAWLPVVTIASSPIMSLVVYFFLFSLLLLNDFKKSSFRFQSLHLPLTSITLNFDILSPLLPSGLKQLLSLSAPTCSSYTCLCKARSFCMHLSIADTGLGAALELAHL
jgi:hypothetical protein